MRLSDSSIFRRESTRPPEFRQDSFESEFDAYTLLYDAFQVRCGPTVWIVLIGPPWLNLSPLLAKMLIGGRPFVDIESTMCVRDRCSEIWIRSEADSELILDAGPERLSAKIQNERCDQYRDLRVLYTLSRDNEISWMIDWAKFHIRRHGANGLLVYDNNSSRYQPVELERALREALPGIVTNVVHWPYVYGPAGFPGKGWWDSDFCQAGAFQHARFRFLALASSVLNCDIDELVIPLRGESIFEATEQRPLGYTSFSGRWISGAPSDTAKDRDLPARHDQFRFLEKLSEECPRKWCVVPNRCDLNHQWKTHGVSGKDEAECYSREFSYRHFRAISTDWKYARSKRVSFEPDKHAFDDALDAELASAEL